MRRKKEEIEEIEEEGEGKENDPKELKKKQREEKKEKRLKKKKQDKAARWAGAVMLFLMMIVGFLLWVSGQIGTGTTEYVRPLASPSESLRQPGMGVGASPTGKVIVR